MRNKIVLQIIENGIITKQKEYKDIYSLSKDYPSVSYYMLREVYLLSMNKNKRKTTPITSQLFQRIRIIDNPRINKNFEELFDIKENDEEPLVTAV
jgi:hypothetical protein